MDYVKKAIWGPDPKEQVRKCQQLVRKNKRQLDRYINDLRMVQKKTQSMIKKAAKSGDKNAVRLYARELVNINKQSDRLHVNRATIDSIGMKLQEQQQMLKIQGSLSKSTEIMREVNSLVSFPQLRNSAQELERELMKSGIINEMVDDLVDEVDEDEELMEEEEVQAINEIIEQYSSDAVGKLPETGGTPIEVASPKVPEKEEEDVSEDNEEVLNAMRERLKALQD
ncbi:hypothetical protein LJB42_000424 [Komagataella kurtzmanii]|nr:hypothetical protein LJB42_000424 [Komagataella kurtzmanii]